MRCEYSNTSSVRCQGLAERASQGTGRLLTMLSALSAISLQWEQKTRPPKWEAVSGKRKRERKEGGSGSHCHYNTA